MDIWNRQPAVSKKGKAYMGYKSVWTPGQSGRLSEADQKPPFYVRNYRPDLGKEWMILTAQTIHEAKDEAAKMEAALDAAAKGVAVLVAAAPPDTLAAKVSEYLDELLAAHGRDARVDAANILENHFLKACRKRLLADVDRKDMLAFKTYLAGNPNLSPRTQHNYTLRVMIFLKWANHKVNFKKKEWPKYTERRAEEYSEVEIKKLLENSEGDDRLKMLCLLTSGMRNRELANLTYADIDFEYSTWGVNPKNGWKPKTEKGVRGVPVPPWLTDKIRERQEAKGAKRTDYIFPVVHGLRKGEALASGFRSDFIKRAAERAGLEVDGVRWDCHKFRSSYATRLLRNASSLTNAMERMGHEHADTMKHYAAALSLKDKEANKRETSINDDLQAAL